MKKLALLLAVMFFSATFMLFDGEKASAADIEMKAVWVSTVFNLDYPSTPTTNASTLKKEADEILQNSKDMGFTDVILQVRPCADSFYPSEYFPYSRYLTGTQGVAPSGGFDPLEYWVEKAHALGLKLHAWINPYRITKSASDFASLTSDHPAKVHPEYVVAYSDGGYYFDPGIPEVQKLIVDATAEIVKNYDVDGIHLDDYFYPGTNFNDAATYQKYGSGFSNIDDWRRNNVNTLVRALDTTLHQIDPDLSFGISPAGIWANKKNMANGSDTNGSESYFSHYADTRYWVKEGMVDYICPQIYWYIGQSGADYSILVKWWSDVVEGTDVKLYIGLADYKLNNSSSTSPWYGIAELDRQHQLNLKTANVSGEVHFRYQFLRSIPGLADYLTSVYKTSSPSTPEGSTPTDPGNSQTIVFQYSPADRSGQWQKLSDGSWKFLLSNGKYASGWRKIDNVWYYFETSGLMKTGHFTDSDGKEYYLNPSNGKMWTGWLLKDGNWYYYWGSGSMAKNSWALHGGKWYYLTGNGTMKTGWLLDRGKWYYLMPGNGDMAYNTVIDGYKIGADGVWIP